MKPTGNTILIIGGTSGIGQGLAQRFLDAGNDVIVTGRRTEQLEKVAAANPSLKTLQLDVTDPASVARALTTVTCDFPEVNVLINNAGIQLPEHLLDGDWLSVAENTVATNLLGPIRMLEAFLPHLVSREDAVIINTSSGLASVPLPITPTYNATKAAIASFTESLRVQLADTSVQVIELVPPATRTTLMGQQDLDTAMPIEAFLGEAMDLLRAQPDADAIVVGFANALRNAKIDGTYDEFLAALSNYPA